MKYLVVEKVEHKRALCPVGPLPSNCKAFLGEPRVQTSCRNYSSSVGVGHPFLLVGGRIERTGFHLLQRHHAHDRRVRRPSTNHGGRQGLHHPLRLRGDWDHPRLCLHRGEGRDKAARRHVALGAGGCEPTPQFDGDLGIWEISSDPAHLIHLPWSTSGLSPATADRPGLTTPDVPRYGQLGVRSQRS